MKMTRLILLGCLLLPLCAANGSPANPNTHAKGHQKTTLLLQEEFESGIEPAGWTEWNDGYHPASWDYATPALAGSGSAAFSGTNGLAFGAFYSFTNTQNQLAMSFLFQCSQYPQNGMEVCDLYDPNGDEICDIYLVPSGYLLLSMGGTPDSMVSTPIPVNTPIRVWINYATGSATDTGTLAWSGPNDPEPTSGPTFTGTTDTTYLNMPVSRFLFGPVYDSSVFIYDDVVCQQP